MITVTFRTFGHLTVVAKGHQTEVELEGDTVQAFLDELVRRFGPSMQSILYPRGEGFSELLYVLINGKNMNHLDGTHTHLKNGDVVSVLPMTAGG